MLAVEGARKLRVEYPGAIYHVLNGGDQRDAQGRYPCVNSEDTRPNG